VFWFIVGFVFFFFGFEMCGGSNGRKLFVFGRFFLFFGEFWFGGGAGGDWWALMGWGILNFKK
jgi:hypothetical protein